MGNKTPRTVSQSHCEDQNVLIVVPVDTLEWIKAIRLFPMPVPGAF
jgi:hypothetical protein